jgi:integrase
VEAVLGALKPVWLAKSGTAAKTRSRIESVLDYAKAHGLRSGENPARWRGHLDHLLPKRQTLSRGHHAALPYRDVASFIARLSERAGNAQLALEFLILTAARTGEVLGARWDEIDLENNI